ncbi:TrbM/KikA/MpfK family conjugal transfer protein [Escherichia coli]|nr:hypothetical protein [Escherichia coli]
MKSKLQLVVLSVALAFTAGTANAADPCETALCMFGKLKGENPAKCDPAVQDYFNIIQKKHGDIRWDATAAARQEFLDSCPKADNKFNKLINDKFGKSRG